MCALLACFAVLWLEKLNDENFVLRTSHRGELHEERDVTLKICLGGALQDIQLFTECGLNTRDTETSSASVVTIIHGILHAQSRS